MEITCPACGRKAEVGPDALQCRRCECDLEALYTIGIAAERCRQEAASALQRRDWWTALKRARESWRLRQTRDGAKLGFMAAIGLRYDDEAVFWSRCVMSQEER